MKTRAVLIVTDDSQFELAVNPTELSVTQDSKDKTIELLNIGEINVPGHRGLIKISISTFLPDSDSPFFTGSAPEDMVQAIKKAKNGKKTVRLIISGTDVNTLFTVASMNETYKEGQQDIYINWTFTESRDLNTVPVSSFVKRYTDTGLCNRQPGNKIPKLVLATANDTLWGLAKRYYDDGSRWVDIAKANGVTKEENIAGMRMVIPE